MSLFSFVFLLFLLVLFLFYFCVPKRFQWIVLLSFSYIFYAFAGLKLMMFLVFSTSVSYLGGLLLSKLNRKYQENIELLKKSPGKNSESKAALKAAFTKRKRYVLAAALVLNFGVLFVVKYGGFIVDNINSIFALIKIEEQISFLNIALPLGISFYTFQSSGYLIDVYRGKVAADKNFFKYALFVSYFPQIIQGPIGRYHELARQLYQPHCFDYTRVKFGAQRVLLGYFKKMVVADRIAVVVNEVFANYALNGYEGFIVFFAVLLYGIQIYADFSAGMDIVLGVSEMLGIKLAENFRRPFLAKNVAEFWQRWHITLGAWMRDYLFYPLALSKPFNKMSKFLRKQGGNYVAKVLPTCLASFIVFVLIGVWHGASWKYVFYGLYQATFVSTATLFEPLYAKLRKLFKVRPERFSWRCFQTLRTVFIITIGRYFSRADSFMVAVGMLGATLKSFNPWVFTDGTLYELGLDEKNFYLMIVLIVLLFAIDLLQERVHKQGTQLRQVIAEQGIVFRWLLYYGAIFGIIIFGMYGSGVSLGNFIYQGF